MGLRLFACISYLGALCGAYFACFILSLISNPADLHPSPRARADPNRCHLRKTFFHDAGENPRFSIGRRRRGRGNPQIQPGRDAAVPAVVTVAETLRGGRGGRGGGSVPQRHPGGGRSATWTDDEDDESYGDEDDESSE